VGPDLTQIGGKFDRPHLIESLLEPSRQIVEGFRSSTVITRDGRSLAGIVSRASDASIQLVDAEGRQHRFEPNEIETVAPSLLSLMPEGIADAITQTEFADLIAYLETLRTGEAKFGAGVSGPISVPSGFDVTVIATGLTGATAMETLGDGRILVCEQTGNLRVIKNGKLLDEPFVSLEVDTNWERGLIGVTVAPDFPRDPYVYVCYVAKTPFPHHHISRFRADCDRAVAGSEEILLVGDDQRKLGGNVPAGHQGGGLHFGADGKLYVGIGEQTAEMPAQRLDTFQGKILRINRDGSIPQDNPFFEKATGKYRAIWAIGCRNPFTFSIQPSTGYLFINDVGGKYEEINRGVAGANYGWPLVDHGPVDNPTYIGPVHIYPQASISGGDFAPAALDWGEAFSGRYFFADFVHGWIKTIDPASPSTADSFATGLRRPVDLRFADDGSLYVLLRNAWVIDDKFAGGTGSLLRIRKIGNDLSH
jgi:putative heme-binding domain-containing protein